MTGVWPWFAIAALGAYHGIDPSMGQRLFDVLHTTKRGGLGLGLSICRKIIGAHGGRLWAEQNVDFIDFWDTD